MAIAKAEITIFNVIDISKVVRYYILKSSTASVPGKPTTNPPSGWTTTEPSYTTGSTNTLYFVDLTVFSDDSFSYSEVSKSSSYEAAKEAYNKAVNAQKSADGAAKTATNYLKYEDDIGLIIGNMTDSKLGKNLLVNKDGINVRDATNILASFSANAITLGAYSEKSLINLCGGKGLISIGKYGMDGEYLQVATPGRLRLESDDEAYIYALENDGGDGNAIFKLGRATDGSGNPTTPYGGISALSSTGAAELLVSQSGSRLSASEYVRIQSYGSYVEIYATNNNIRTYSKNFKLTDSDLTLNGDFILNGKLSMSGKLTLKSALDIGNGGTGATTAADARKNIGTWCYDVATNSTYPGLARPDGTTTGYVRTPQTGLLPYQSGGHGTVGTSSWPFNNGYFNNLYSGDVKITGNTIYLPNASTLSGTNTSGNARALIQYNGNNNTVVGYGGYSSGEGSLNLYGNRVYIYSKTAGASVKPYYEKGDSVSAYWWVCGYASSSSTSVYFTIFMDKPIIGGPTATVSSIDGFIVRQNGYAYGSSASGYIKPSSYTATIIGNGTAIRIAAKMPNITNINNNNPCAVSASIKITFS